MPGKPWRRFICLRLPVNAVAAPAVVEAQRSFYYEHECPNVRLARRRTRSQARSGPLLRHSLAVTPRCTAMQLRPPPSPGRHPYADALPSDFNRRHPGTENPPRRVFSWVEGSIHPPIHCRKKFLKFLDFAVNHLPGRRVVGLSRSFSYEHAYTNVRLARRRTRPQTRTGPLLRRFPASAGLSQNALSTPCSRRTASLPACPLPNSHRHPSGIKKTRLGGFFVVGLAQCMCRPPLTEKSAPVE